MSPLLQVNESIALGRLLNFIEAGVLWLLRVRLDTGSHHIPFDVDDAAVQVMIGFDCRGVMGSSQNAALRVLRKLHCCAVRPATS
jgi:hypothetical protein